MEPLSIVGLLGLAGSAVAGLRYLWEASGVASRRERLERACIDAQTLIEVERARAVGAACASVVGAPRSIHYAPHITHAAPTSAHTDAHTASGDTVSPPSLPGVTDLADLGFTPSAQSILLALQPGGGLVTVPARDLMHVALLGNTGGGKSNTIRLLASQLLAVGSEVVLLDPHFASFDAESGDDWRPIASRATVASSDSAIDDQLQRASDLIDERLAARAAGRRVGLPVTLIVDELPVILSNVRGAMDRISRLLREGRKVAIYFVGASQDMLTKTLGGGGAIRDNFRTAYYAGGDAASAAVLLDMPRREINECESTLGRGVVLLRSASSAASLARVPLASNRGIARLLGAGGGDFVELPKTGTHDSSAVHDGSDVGTDDELIRLLVQRGLSANKICEIVGGTRGIVLAKVRAAKAADSGVVNV